MNKLDSKVGDHIKGDRTPVSGGRHRVSGAQSIIQRYLGDHII